MEYLAPVINHVHNNLGVHLTLKLTGGRYSIPAKSTTKLDFDVMSLASGSDRADLFDAIANKYITIDVYMLTNGKYVKVGSYETQSKAQKLVKSVGKVKAVKSEDIAKSMGITVDPVDTTVTKEPTKAPSITKVTPKEEPALDPVKEISKPKTKTKAVKEDKPVLDSVKSNNKDA